MLILFGLSGMAVRTIASTQESFEHFVSNDFRRDGLAREVQAAADARAVAARNLLLVSEDTDIAVEKNAVAQAHERMQERLGQLRALLQAPDVSAEERKLFESLEQIEARYGVVAQAIVELTLQGQREAAIHKLTYECRPLLAELMRKTSAYVAYIRGLGESNVEAAARAYAAEKTFLLSACGLALAIAAVLAWRITHGLMRALGADPSELRAVARRVAAGELSEIVLDEKVHQSSVLASLADMQVALARIVRRVRSSAETIAASSAQIDSSNTDLAQRTEQQATRLQHSSSTMEQLHGTVVQNAEHAHQATALASTASQSAEHGGQVVREVVQTMEDIAASSRRIENIIGVIDGIAFQTNLLALNAAVEAARAGEQGRGFSVVASEVRVLAQRSAEAAKEIKQLIDASMSKVSQGVTHVQDAGVTMEQLVHEVKSVAGLIAEISGASRAQTQGIGEVTASVSELDIATQQNASLVEEMAGASSSLRDQAKQLMAAVSLFNVNQTAIPGDSGELPNMQYRSMPTSTAAKAFAAPGVV